MSLRVLIFGTTYVDTPERMRLTEKWAELHASLNPDCDLLLVDSASPVGPVDGLVPTGGSCAGNGRMDMRFSRRGRLRVHAFADNIGHLARGGLDGWGRAFCHGLKTAKREHYDYVVHIEGDSLFRLPVMPIVEQMHARGVRVASVPVRGTKRVERNWVETGLMLFEAAYLRASNLVDKYDWPNGGGKVYPLTPEWHLYQLVLPLLHMMPWSAERGDLGQITPANVGNYDWITHVAPETADAFARSAVHVDA